MLYNVWIQYTVCHTMYGYSTLYAIQCMDTVQCMVQCMALYAYAVHYMHNVCTRMCRSVQSEVEAERGQREGVETELSHVREQLRERDVQIEQYVLAQRVM